MTGITCQITCALTQNSKHLQLGWLCAFGLGQAPKSDHFSKPVEPASHLRQKPPRPIDPHNTPPPDDRHHVPAAFRRGRRAPRRRVRPGAPSHHRHHRRAP
jgi:hypothetical protein